MGGRELANGVPVTLNQPLDSAQCATVCCKQTFAPCRAELQLAYK